MAERRADRWWTLVAGIIVAAGLVVGAQPATAADFPSKDVEILVPFSPGGGIDLAGRTVARLLTDLKLVPRPVVVINRPGAGGLVGMTEMVSKRKGDGHSLMVVATHIHSTPLTQGNPISYASVTPLARLFAEYQLLVVRTESPFKSLEDVVQALKRDPGAVKIGGASIGSADHVTVARLALALGFSPSKLTYIGYGGGESNPAILGGHVDVGTGGVDLMSLVAAGRMRALAISAPTRLGGALAVVPTFKEQGYDVVQANWRGLFGPPGMPEAATRFWRTALTAMARSPQWKADLEKNQWVDAFNAETFTEDLKEEYKVYRTILKDLGLVK